MSIKRDRVSPLSIVSLILVNLIPVYGVYILKWSLFSVMFLYWAESSVIGFFNILKMARAEGTGKSNFQINDAPADRYSRFGLISFFTLHYGIFMMVHFGFVVSIFGPSDMTPWQIAFAFLLLFVSHGISYIANFLGSQEYLHVSPAQQMSKPYSRIILLHVTILFGGFMAKLSGAKEGAIILMIFFKIVIDLILHVNEHKMFNLQNSKQ